MTAALLKSSCRRSAFLENVSLIGSQRSQELQQGCAIGRRQAFERSGRRTGFLAMAFNSVGEGHRRSIVHQPRAPSRTSQSGAVRTLFCPFWKLLAERLRNCAFGTARPKCSSIGITSPSPVPTSCNRNRRTEKRLLTERFGNRKCPSDDLRAGRRGRQSAHVTRGASDLVEQFRASVVETARRLRGRLIDRQENQEHKSKCQHELHDALLLVPTIWKSSSGCTSRNGPSVSMTMAPPKVSSVVGSIMLLAQTSCAGVPGSISRRR